MRILVVNAGSSSLKSQLIETDGKVSLMKCLAEKVGTPDAYMNVSFAPDFQKATYRVADMTVAECLKKLLEVLVDDPESPISDLSQVDAIGNRIVAGGEYFTKSVIIDEPAREKLELCEELAPLHNPPADACIDMMAARRSSANECELVVAMASLLLQADASLLMIAPPVLWMGTSKSVAPLWRF